MSRRLSNASGIFIASPLVSDSPHPEKENAEPRHDTPAATPSADVAPRYVIALVLA